MSGTRNNHFLDLIRKVPGFSFADELKGLVDLHGPDTPELLQAIIDAKLLGKDEACRQWANGLGFAYVDPFASIVTDEAVEAVPLEIATKTRSIGLYVIEGILTVAMATPEDEALVRRLAQIVQMPGSPVFASVREIDDAIAIHYSNDKDIEESLGALEHMDIFNRPEYTKEQLAALAETAPLVRVLESIVYFAIRERATDIHIEPQELQSRIRFRVDGMLREVLTFSRKIHRALISRLKILCTLNITESRFPQDGRFSMEAGGGTTNFRVSMIPSMFGEKSVVRILATTGRRSMVTLDKMMM